ncbi:DUF418 domain-containing protein [Chitinimonas sp. PSY-7]|uniref:DUF418 domain-containing protein n=1 Tax=Chitinimonas sp. PSY-7 TaxID=3459088 RepID=UPI00403FF45A
MGTLCAASAILDLLARLAPARKMALSNYLFQSVVCCLIFTAYEIATAWSTGAACCFADGITYFCHPDWLSERWLRPHRYGTVEWLLRAITLAAWPEWRRLLPDSTRQFADDGSKTDQQCPESS